MPLKNGGFQEQFFEGLAALPLPGAALVIDVRKESNDSRRLPPLLEYLARSLEELGAEMRLNEVARWRRLADCIEFLRIERVATDADEQGDTNGFTLITRDGKQIPIQDRNDLEMTIGRGYIDRVRNQHIAAIRDNGPDEEELSASEVDPEQPTVRVVFLTDDEDEDSLTWARVYARWLNAWIDEQHGIRANRDRRISIVAVCLNVPVNSQHTMRLLGAMSSNGMKPESEFDSIILIQAYRDDGAYIGGEAQVAQAELILYTLLLHWPDILTPEGQGMWYESDTGSYGNFDARESIICPTYTIGIAAQEFSARWGGRLLDYRLTARSLERMRDVKKVEEELKTLHAAVQGWYKTWWETVQNIIPGALYGLVSEVDGLYHLHRLVSRSPFRSGSRRQAPEELRHFSDEVSSLYQSSGYTTLERAIESAPFLLDRVRQSTSNFAGATGAQETSTQLTGLYVKAQQFTDTLFSEARGAVPRAVQQIAMLRDCANELRNIQRNPPNIETMRGQIERETKEADALLRRKIYAPTLPMVGEVLPSTVLSLLLALLLAVVLCVVVGGASSVPAGLRQPLAVGITGVQILCVLAVAALESGFLLLRNAWLKQEQQAVYRKLRETMKKHLTEVSVFVAANAALTLLELAALYRPNQESSPYEERLKQLDKTLADAHIAAQHHHTIAEQRLQLSLDRKPLKNALESAWPSMSNRRDFLTWKELDEGYLFAFEGLEEEFLPLKFLSRMLVRHMGTEDPETILQSILPTALNLPGKARQITMRSRVETPERQLVFKTGDEIRFQLLSTMLAGVLLSSDIVPLAVRDVMPLIERYNRQKKDYMTEPSVLTSDVLDLNDVVRETMLEQTARAKLAITNFTLRPDASPEFVLAAWMKQQKLLAAGLTESLEENDVITLLDRRKIRLDQAMDDLRRKSRLAGYPDDITGEDYFLLLLAPGVISNAFVVNEETFGVKPVYFPDAEKIVYLHIHRLRRLYR